MEQDLRRLLDELDAAIDRTREGQENSDELARLVAAVEQKLNPDQEDPDTFVENLEEAAAQFQAEHPTLTEAIRRVIDTLGASGI